MGGLNKLNNLNNIFKGGFKRFLENAHPQNCLICQGLQPKMICDACQKLWFENNNERCDCCGLALKTKHLFYKQNHQICPDCEYTRFNFKKTTVLFDYVWPIQQLIHRIKNGDVRLTQYLAEALFNQYLKALNLKNLNETFIILYVPSALQKIHKRGFNPSLSIAQVFAKKLKSLLLNYNDLNNLNNFNIKNNDKNNQQVYVLDLFSISKNNQQKNRQQAQKDLNQAERFSEMDGRYCLNLNLNLKSNLKSVLNLNFNLNNSQNIRFILIDDVMTTGATLHALAGLLQNYIQNDLNNLNNLINFSIETCVLARALCLQNKDEVQN